MPSTCEYDPMWKKVFLYMELRILRNNSGFSEGLEACVDMRETEEKGIIDKAMCRQKVDGII